jgi:uncharacterized protein
MSRESYTIDSAAFAREGRQLAGRLPVAGFERLAEIVVAESGDVQFEVTGFRDEDHDALFLDIVASGTLMLRCERCLEAMPWPVRAEGRLLLVPPGQPLPDEALDEEDFDPIHASRTLEVLPLVEDEVLLALPYAPRHEQCEPPRPLGGAEKESPFAVLQQLRDGKGEKK